MKFKEVVVELNKWLADNVKTEVIQESQMTLNAKDAVIIDGGIILPHNVLIAKDNNVTSTRFIREGEHGIIMPCLCKRIVVSIKTVRLVSPDLLDRVRTRIALDCVDAS